MKVKIAGTEIIKRQLLLKLIPERLKSNSLGNLREEIINKYTRVMVRRQHKEETVSTALKSYGAFN